jgi:phosphoglucosamine mutase
MDTRESSPWLAAAVAGGLLREDIRVRFAGVITTPGVACLARSDSFAAGVMISASHNPYRDNGIKIFGHTGYKLPDATEHALEQEIFGLLESGVSPAEPPLLAEPALGRRYLDFLAATISEPLDGVRIVVDCANGAASELAPELLKRLGAAVEPIACSPDGRNINLNCGALHVGALRDAVLSRGADLGVALDGDADRAIFVSRTGRIIDGDAVLLLAARFLHARGRLAGSDGRPLVVATVMSNLGLERALDALGIRLLRAPVGDKYVLEAMLRSGALLGGEQSGHVIFHDYSTAGDGLLTSLRILEILRSSNAGLDELTAGLQLYPQRLVNVPVRARVPFDELPAVSAVIRGASESFGDAGRVLVRYSGTELLARVMVEGREEADVEAAAQRIARAIRSALGC